MKRYTFHSQSTPARSRTQSTCPAAVQPVSAIDLVAEIFFAHTETVDKVASILRHPRSLARPVADWRPPSITLPSVGQFPELMCAVSRRRVGPRAKARIQGFGEDRTPAYLITSRLTDPQGFDISRACAEAWVRCLVPQQLADAVHEIPGTAASTTFVWLVDRDYLPVHSPISMFEGLNAAA